MMTVKRINIGSAFKVGAMVSLLISAIFGLIFVLLYGAFVSALIGTFEGSTTLYSPGGTVNVTPSDVNVMQTIGWAGLCFSYVIQVIFSAIFGGIFGAVLAFAYNLAARWVGGLEVEFERSPHAEVDAGYKPKRSSAEF